VTGGSKQVMVRSAVSRLRSAALQTTLLLVQPTFAHTQHRHAPLDLVAEFQRTKVFWQQLKVAERIAHAGDRRVLKDLEPWLSVEDRHLRGNAAFVFARLGDRRGFETLRFMLADYSYRPEGQGIPGGSFNMEAAAWWLPSQIRADRYYAVHLFGKLKDRRAVAVLTPLLDDEEINYNVAWALGEIGDRRAIPPLISALIAPKALMRASAIQALVKLDATDALPDLQAMLDDQAMPSAGPRVTVGETARAAIATLQKEP
jgi:HEAT repeat protein